MSKLLRISIFTPVKLLNNPLASYFLRNVDFLLIHTAHFDKRIVFSLDYITLFKITLFYIYFTLLFINRIFSFFFHIIKFFWRITH